MHILAHIGNVPVEEWLPFVVPVVLLYVYGRHKYRRRREAVEHLPAASQMLSESVVAAVVERWAAADHKEMSADMVALLYPPGPDGMTPGELASRVQHDPLAVERLLEDLQELGYLDLEPAEDPGERRVWLTIEGHGLVELTADELLALAGPLTQAGSARSASHRSR
jgi:DNA-binding MarR family transcriptional regulator